ncbi:MAG: peptidoglycan-binding protein [Clostridia bacterium]|nr:peptidoglycan-binding protein [Clostridia bacterium]
MLKRRFLALLVLACLLVTAVAVPGAVASQTTTGNVYDFSATYSSSTEKVTVKFSVKAGTTIDCDSAPSMGFHAIGWVIATDYDYNETVTLSPGTYTFSITEHGTPSQTITQTVTVPAPKPITIANVTSPAANTLRITGTAEPGKRVVLFLGGEYIDGPNALANASGNYTLEYIYAPASDYTNNIAVHPAADPAYDTPSVQYAGSKVTVLNPKALTITSVTLEGRNSLRVIGEGYPGDSATLTTDPASAPRSFTVGSDGKYNVLITNMPVNTYTEVIATYFGTSLGQTGGPAKQTGSWVVAAATADDITITDVLPGVRSVVVEGTGKPGTTVRATVGGTSGASGTGPVGADGKFKISITLAPGDYVGASVVYTTAGIGNGASTSETYTVTDTAATATPGPTPLPTPIPTGTYPTLSRGMVNAYVTTLQLYLRDLGYYTIRIDGIFGIGTETGVRNFQIMNNLPATGIADDATQKLLYSGNAIGIGPAPPPGFSTLQFGSRGTAVRNMQVRLANLGYYFGAIDGIFGSQTQAAVRQFQTRNNLAVTGIANAATQTAIFSTSALPNGNASTGYVYLQSGSRGPAVVRLQTALRDAGFNPGPIDGIYGSQTVNAVKSFQRARGLVVDGIAGRRTQNALYGTNY